MASEKQGDETILEEAKNLLVQGKRFMALEDYHSATDALEQCCQLFDAFYGVAKRECADAYLEYGNALCALADIEAGSGTDKLMKKAGIDGKIEDEDEEDDDDEEADDEDEEGEDEEAQNVDEEVAKDDQEVKQNNASEAEKKVNGDHVPMEAEQIPKEASDQKKANTNGVSTSHEQPQASSSSADPTPGTSSGKDGISNGDDEEAAENEEATTIEIAWEVLCLAKRLYMTDESLEGRLKLAETLHKIGEISIEWDNNDNAVSILEECLEIRKAILPPDDRLIALTYYNLGLAHSFKSETESANDNFQKAMDVIEKRISNLSEDLQKAKDLQDTVAISSYSCEINELKELLPDMKMRMDDDSKEDSAKSSEILKRTREEMQLEDEEAKKVCSDQSKPVDDISHLVKRKAT